MKQNILIVFVNTNSLESSLIGLTEIENNFINSCKVLLIDNGGLSENSLRPHHSDFRCVKDYLVLPETDDVGVVLDKIQPSINRHRSEYIYFVIKKHKNTISHLPVLMSMHELSSDSVLGIRGGSIFSSFFHNYAFFQKNTKTEWLDFNGMLIPKDVWSDNNKIDMRYYREYHQVYFGYNLIKKGLKLFKLKPYLYNRSRGLINYFRMRNPFLFLHINFNFGKYIIGALYFLIQLPYAVIYYFWDKNYLNGLFDGVKLLYFKYPSSTSL